MVCEIISSWIPTTPGSTRAGGASKRGSCKMSSSENKEDARCMPCARRSVMRRWLSSRPLVRRTCAAWRLSFAPSRTCESSGRTRPRSQVSKTPLAKPRTNEMVLGSIRYRWFCAARSDGEGTSIRIQDPPTGGTVEQLAGGACILLLGRCECCAAGFTGTVGNGCDGQTALLLSQLVIYIESLCRNIGDHSLALRIETLQMFTKGFTLAGEIFMLLFKVGVHTFKVSLCG